MTALAAGFALLPLMIGADDASKEILHPTLLDAVLTPILFLRYGARPLERLAAVGAAIKASDAY